MLSDERWRPLELLTPSRFRALRQEPLAAFPHTVHPQCIHQPDNRLRSRSFAAVRDSAFSASGQGKSNGGERRRPCQQGLISPWSQVQIPPPPPEEVACTSQTARASQPTRAAGAPLVSSCLIQPHILPSCSSSWDAAVTGRGSSSIGRQRLNRGRNYKPDRRSSLL